MQFETPDCFQVEFENLFSFKKKKLAEKNLRVEKLVNSEVVELVVCGDSIDFSSCDIDVLELSVHLSPLLVLEAEDVVLSVHSVDLTVLRDGDLPHLAVDLLPPSVEPLEDVVGSVDAPGVILVSHGNLLEASRELAPLVVAFVLVHKVVQVYSKDSAIGSDGNVLEGACHLLPLAVPLEDLALVVHGPHVLFVGHLHLAHGTLHLHELASLLSPDLVVGIDSPHRAVLSHRNLLQRNSLHFLPVCRPNLHAKNQKREKTRIQNGNTNSSYKKQSGSALSTSRTSLVVAVAPKIPPDFCTIEMAELWLVLVAALLASSTNKHS